MANRTNHPKKKVEPIIEAHIDEPVEVPVIIEEKPAEVVTIENTILLENIQAIRFIDDKGKLFRLEIHQSGVYWLYPA